MPITEDAVDLLRKVQKAIREQPEHFDMGHWFVNPGFTDEPIFRDDGVIEIPDTDYVPEVPMIKLLESCGTTACLAGWIVAVSGEKANPGEYIAASARRMIGFEALDGECPLFFNHRWPDDLADRYLRSLACGDYPGMADTACEAIDAWIEADGDEEIFHQLNG